MYHSNVRAKEGEDKRNIMASAHIKQTAADIVCQN